MFAHPPSCCRHFRRLVLENLETRYLLTGAWSSAASLPVAVGSSPHIESQGDKIYVAGGNDGVGAVGNLQIYDEGTDSWSAGAPMSRRYDGSSAVIGDNLYVAGGWNPPDSFIPTRTLQVYHIPTDSWSAGPMIPSAASPPLGLSGCSAGEAVGSQFFLLSACNGFSGLFNFFAAFDAGTNTWSDRPDPSAVHAGGTANAIGGKLFVAGGTDSAGTPTAVLESFDPVSDTWTTLAPMPTARSGVAGAVLDGKLYVLGGWNGSSVSDVVEIYDPATNTWSTGVPMPTPRQALDAVTIGSSIYAVGGNGAAGTPLSTVEVFSGQPETLVSLSGSSLLIEDVQAGGKDDNLTIDFDSSNNQFVITDPGASLQVTTPGGIQVSSNEVRVPLADVTGNEIIVNTLDGSDTLTVRPALTLLGGTLRYDGGDPSSSPGDTLNLDLSGVPEPHVVDTASGQAFAAGSTALFSNVETVVVDGHLIAQDHLSIRTTSDDERIVFTSWSDGGVRLRIDNFDQGTSTTLATHFGLVGGVQQLVRLVAVAGDGDDFISVSRVLDANGDPIPVEFHGGAGNDYLAGSPAADLLVGGPGRDRVLGYDGDNQLFGDGNEFVGGTLLELPTDGDDNVSGRNGDDRIWGGGGNDTLSGLGGNDVINGGSGNDRVDGGAGDDLLRGMAGDDTLSGNTGNDFLLGATGRDRLLGRGGDNILIGGEGADSLYADRGNDLLVSGTTDNDADDDAVLQAILAAWVSNPTPDAFDSPLSGILGDGDRDDLLGSSGDDEFWATLGQDRVRDGNRDAGDVVNDR